MPALISVRRSLLSRLPPVSSGGFTAFDKGFNFRETSGYVTDGANETYVTGNDGTTHPTQYPTTRNSVTFGYTVDFGAPDNARDRSTLVDRRLAGMMFQPNDGTQPVFRVDLLSAGTYSIYLAVGDATNARTGQRVEILDGSTSRLVVAGNTIAGSFLDATGTSYTAALWPGSETPASITMSGTILNMKLATSTNVGDLTCIAHLRVLRTA